MIIDVIAPSSGVVKKDINIPGHTLRIPQDLINMSYPYHANSDKLRFKYTLDALSNNESQVVWCLRGGYGAAKVVEQLIASGFKPKQEKAFIGFSDITALHIYLNQYFGWKTIHGAVLSQLNMPEYNQDNFKRVLEIIDNPKTKVIFPGLNLISEICPPEVITGIVSGGNLALLTSSIGTGWQIETEGKILIIEDVNERGYKIDRMLSQLKSAGLLDEVRGIIFNFTNGNEADGSNHVDYAIYEFAKSVAFPVFTYDKIGHSYDNQPFVIGALGLIENADGEYNFIS